MMKNWNRVLALLLAVMLCVSLLPLGVLADEEDSAEVDNTVVLTSAEEESSEALIEDTLNISSETEESDSETTIPEEDETSVSAAAEPAAAAASDVELAEEEGHTMTTEEASAPEETAADELAVDGAASGTCGDDLTWMLSDDGVLTISGTGAMKDYYSSAVPWNLYRSSITSVTVSDSVSSIGDYAFYECKSLTSITIPDSVTSIGEGAFYGCSALTSVTIPDSVTSIGDYAFYYCSSLTSVAIPEGVTSIGAGTFSRCSSLTSITIPDSVTSIGDAAFWWCGLTSITIPEGVTSIGDGAFEVCWALTSITIPEGVTSIGEKAFYGCVSLTSVTIPDSVTSIGDRAFHGCDSLTSVTIPDSVTSIGRGAFYKCSALTSAGPIGGGYDYEYGWTESIPAYAFNCSELTSITIPSSVTSIGDEAFSGCLSLTSITIPEGVTSIGYAAFHGCSSLTSITIPEGVTSIGDNAFYYCSSLTSVTIPSGVTSIGEFAFFYCTGLTSITIPASVTSIGDHAFYGCPDLVITVDEDNTTYHSAGNCLIETESKTLIRGFNSSVIPSDGSVTSIWGSAFYGCSSLTSVTIPDSVTSIGYAAFYGCSSLTSITIPASVTSIEGEVFQKCSSLTSITIPDGVTSIGNYAFNRCSSLTSITIPASVTSIGLYAFDDCSSLTDVYYAGSEDEWNAIEIHGSNEPLTNATIHYNSTGPVEIGEPVEAKPISGEFVYNSMFSTASDHNWTYSFDYDDSWLFSDNAEDEYSLTKMSIRVAMAAYGLEETHSPENIKALMDQLGFDYMDQPGFDYTTDSVHYPEPEYDSIGYAIGLKNVIFEDETTRTILLVAIRGGGYGVEWGGDFNVGQSGDHMGFSIAASAVMASLNDFIERYKDCIQDDFKVWIVGYSRGAATANLVAAGLDKGYYDNVSAENVRAFCFECPMSTTDSSANASIYNNIINIVNPLDFVPRVPLAKWGFTRYGKTYYIPSYEVNTNYLSLWQAMANTYYGLYNSFNNSTYCSADVMWISAPTPMSEFTGDSKVNKTWGQASWFDYFFDKMAKRVSRHEYYNSHQAKMIKIAASALGGASDAAWYDYVLELCNIGDVGVYHPLATSVVLGLFANGNSQNTSTGAYGHYPELCLSWVDSLSGFGAFNNQWLSKYRMAYINCPVDVSVYDSAGNLVGQIIDDEIQAIENGVVIRIDDDGQKVVIMPRDAEYSIEMKATDNGEVTYTTTEYNFDTGETERVVSYQEIEVEKGEVLTGTVENLTAVSEAKYPLYTDDGEKMTPDVDLSGSVSDYNVTVSATGKGTASGGGYYVTGEFAKVTATPDEGATFRGWYVEDTLVSEETEYRFLVTEDVEIKASFSEPTAATGVCGDNLTWTLTNDGVLTISGTGDMTDYASSDDVPWHAYCSSIEKVVIESGITSIGSNVFAGCASLEEITFKGAAPDFGEDVFAGVTATAYYPEGDDTWTEDVMQDYGGTITWEAVSFQVPGDVDGDGEVTGFDASLILQYEVGLIDESGLDLSVADVDGDGEVTGFDASLILQYEVGLIDSF